MRHRLGHVSDVATPAQLAAIKKLTGKSGKKPKKATAKMLSKTSPGFKKLRGT